MRTSRQPKPSWQRCMRSGIPRPNLVQALSTVAPPLRTRFLKSEAAAPRHSGCSRTPFRRPTSSTCPAVSIARLRRARASADAVTAARDTAKVVIAAETAHAYAAICALGEELNVARHSLDVVSHELQITSQRLHAGAGSEFDVDRAQAEVSQVQAAIPQLAGARRVALFELAALLGKTPADAPQDLDACVAPPRLTALIPVGDGRMLIRRRPDVRQAERRLAAATAEIGVTTAELYAAIRLLRNA